MPWIPAFNIARCVVELTMRFSDVRKMWKLPTVDRSVTHVIIMNTENASTENDSVSFSQLVRAITIRHTYVSTVKIYCKGEK